MFYPVAMFALVALNTAHSAPAFFGRTLEASAVLHHVAGRPRAGIGNAKDSKKQADTEADAVSSDPENSDGTLLTGKELKELFSGNSPYGFAVHDDTGPFQQYFAKNGTARGQDEKASWAIEGDTICIEYDSDGKNCFGVRPLPDATYALESEGKIEAYFKVAEGNPFEY